MNESIKGYRPPLAFAFRAKCFDCIGDLADGRKDCLIKGCPVYFYMPFRKSNDIDWSWVFGKWAINNEENAKALGITSPEEYARHLWGNEKKFRPSRSKIVRAKCFRCCSDYHQSKSEKGRVDCGVPDCPFYYWTPYRQNFPQYDWMFDLSCSKKYLREMHALGLSKEEYIYRLLVEKDL